MEENKKEAALGARTIVSKDGKNLINLRQVAAEGNRPPAATEPQGATSPAPAVRGRSEIKSDFAGADFSSNFLDRVLERGLYLLVFLMPLFLLPSPLASYEFSKSFLLVVASSLLLFVWTLNHVFVKGKLSLLKSSLTPAFGFFVLAVLLSALFSVDRTTSFLGYYGTFSDSFLFTLSLFVFYFLGSNLIAAGNADKIVSRLVGTSVYAALLASAVGIFYFLNIKLLPFFGGVTAGFNLTSDYARGFAIYLLAMFFVAAYDFSFFNRYKPAKKMVDALAAVLIFLNLVLIGWAWVWPVFFLAFVSVIIGGGLLDRKTLASANGLLIFVTVLITAAFFLTSLDLGRLSSGQLVFANSSLSNSVRSSLKVDDSKYATAIQEGFARAEATSIATASFKASPVLGSGVGTYAYDFAKYKTNSFNYDDDWSLRFGKAYNEMLEKVSTLGVLGVIAYALLLLVSLLLFFKVVRKEKRDGFLLAAFLVLVVFQFLFLETAILKFLFVFLLLLVLGRDLSEEGQFALAASTSGRREKKLLVIDANRGLFKRMLAPIAILVILSSAAVAYYAFRFYQAEAAYEKISQVADPEAIADADLERMVRSNSSKGEYAVVDSRIRMARIEKMFRSDPTGQSSADRILSESEKTLASAQRATTISPRVVLFWENYGFIYRRMRVAGMKGAEDWAIKGFQSALELDPNNVVYQTEIGKLYLIKYQDAASSEEDKRTNLSKAQQEIEKAVALKSDYADAVTELALIYSYKNDKTKALELVGQAKLMKKISPETAVQMGRIYYGLKEYAAAEEVLGAVIAKNEDNSDAHYVLGIVYKDQKKNDQALAEFKTVLQSNPGNEDVTDKIAELEKSVAGSSADQDTERASDRRTESYPDIAPETESDAEAGGR